jgi:hypothetical protein
MDEENLSVTVTSSETYIVFCFATMNPGCSRDGGGSGTNVNVYQVAMELDVQRWRV